MANYQKLLEPVQIGSHRWKNRIVKAPSSAMSWDPGQFCNDRIIGLYDAIAKGGAGAIILGGMVCDGAKSSCAAKIASSLESALLGYEMAKEQRGFTNGEGIVKADVEATIASVGRMAAAGMRSTDREILEIMVSP